MQMISNLRLQQKLRRSLLVLGAIAALAGQAVHAENLDEGKSAGKLFADNCGTCHRGARGLAKGRFRVTLYLFLQQHYASNSSSAWALASYLASVEDARRAPSRRGAAKPSPAAVRTSGFSLRPPLPVPDR
jgi:hypothetical protein